MGLKQTLKELQRRHVVKAGIAYLVLSWLIIQVLSILFPAFEASPSALKMTILVLGIGFPIWLVIAWVYDFSHEGIKKTGAVTYDPEISRKKNIGLNRIIIGGLSITVILLVFNTFRMSTKIDSIYQEALAANFTSSIAVLAFDDLSPNQDQDYIAKGLGRQIQQRLARHKDLNVISTNSSYFYKDKDVSIEVIGEELGVSFILNGSVLKSGETIRVDIDLVSTKNGSSIWSKQFDQKGEDILYLYDEIAKAIVKYLKLTFDYEDVRLKKVDPEAFDLYLKAEHLIGFFKDSTSIIADSLIRRSIKIDSTYSGSWATLSMTTLHNGLYAGKNEKEEAVKIGLKAAKKAIELDPENTIALVWLSNWQWHNKEVNLSNDNLSKALELEPNNSEVLTYGGHQSMRSNRLKDGIAFTEKAMLIDPKFRDSYTWLWQMEVMIGDIDSAVINFKTATELSVYKEDYDGLAYLYFYQKKYDLALETIEKESNEYWRVFLKVLIFDATDKKDEANALLETFQNLIPREFNEVSGKDFDLAILYASRRDMDKAFHHLNQSLDVIYLYLEWFFTTTQFKNLYDDPRWDELLDKIGEEFNYDFKH